MAEENRNLELLRKILGVG